MLSLMNPLPNPRRFQGTVYAHTAVCEDMTKTHPVKDVFVCSTGKVYSPVV